MYAFVVGDSEVDEEGREGGTFSRAHETILSTLSCPNLFVCSVSVVNKWPSLSPLFNSS